MDLSDVGLAQVEHTDTGLADAAADGVGQLLLQNGLVEIQFQPVQIPGGSQMIIYLGEPVQTETALVPDVTGMDAEAANGCLQDAGLYMRIIGATGGESTIAAVDQTPKAGESVSAGTVVEVEFSDLSARD